MPMEMESSQQTKRELVMERRLRRKQRRRDNLSKMVENRRLQNLAKQEENRRLKMLAKEPEVDSQSSKKNPPKVKKDYAYMTDDEIVNLCVIIDRPRARRVVGDLRRYLSQLAKSEGFDVDVFPGSFDGLPDIRPTRYCGDDTVKYGSHGWVAVVGIAKYNAAHPETKFKVVKVQNVNVSLDVLFCTYYITFFARDVKSDGMTEPPLKTFQARVEIHRLPPFKGNLSSIAFCRPKPNSGF